MFSKHDRFDIARSGIAWHFILVHKDSSIAFILTNPSDTPNADSKRFLVYRRMRMADFFQVQLVVSRVEIPIQSETCPYRMTCKEFINLANGGFVVGGSLCSGVSLDVTAIFIAAAFRWPIGESFSAAGEDDDDLLALEGIGMRGSLSPRRSWGQRLD